jgi:hypothetical protein
MPDPASVLSAAGDVQELLRANRVGRALDAYLAAVEDGGLGSRLEADRFERLVDESTRLVRRAGRLRRECCHPSSLECGRTAAPARLVAIALNAERARFDELARLRLERRRLARVRRIASPMWGVRADEALADTARAHALAYLDLREACDLLLRSVSRH